MWDGIELVGTGIDQCGLGGPNELFPSCIFQSI